MKNNRRLATLLAALAAVTLLSSAAAAQTKLGAAEYKDDEFTGKRKVTLAEQQIAPTLKMSLAATVSTSRKRGTFEPDLDFAEINLTSTTGRREYGGLETEVNFIVDGARVRGGKVESSPLRDKMPQDGKELAVGVLYLSTLEKIARGRDVQMKVGENVFKLDKPTLQAVQDFLKAAGR